MHVCDVCGVLQEFSRIFRHSQSWDPPHLGSYAFMRKPVPLTFTFSSLPPGPHPQPHPDPAAQAAEMACKRIFLITGTTSSPWPSLLLPPPLSIPPSFSSSPSSFLSPCLPSTLTHAGREGKIVSSAIFHTSLKCSARLFPAERRDNRPPGASRLSEDPQNTYPLREPSLPSLATPHRGKRPLKNKTEQTLCFLVERLEGHPS